MHPGFPVGCRQPFGFALVLLLLGLSAAGQLRAAEPADEPHPLGLSLQVLERDLTNKEYLAVLDTMIPTDLAAEWKRVATADNYETFADRHGGLEKVQADPQLKAAYERRKEIADRFLDLMRTAYKKRNLVAPFDKGEKLDLLDAGTRAAAADLPDIPLRIVLPAPEARLHWPRFRGPTGQGEVLGDGYPLTWNESDNILWKVEPAGLGNGSPIVWGNRLFLTAASEDGHDRWLACYSCDTGEQLWKLSAPTTETVEKLYWKNSFASATPVTDGERVIAFLGNGGLLCADLDGRQLWHVDLGAFDITHGPGASPVLVHDKVILLQDQNRKDSLFVAFDKQTGRKLWQQPRERGTCWSTPVVVHVGDHDELLCNNAYQVNSYRPETGERLWWTAGPSQEVVPSLVVGGGLIYSFSGRNGPMLAIRPGGHGDIADSHIVWKLPRGGPHVPSPLYYEGRLYLTNDTGIASCLEAATGETIWQKRLRGRFSISPLHWGNRILLINETGTTTILEAGPKFKLLATNSLEGDTLATPAFVGGKIYWRTKSHLLCIGSP